MSNLVYEDNPCIDQQRSWKYQLLFGSQTILPTLVVLAVAVPSSIWTEHEIVFFSGLFLAIAFTWARQPRKYQIFDSKIRIFFKGQFHFDVPFNKLEYASEGEGTERFELCWNFITSLSKNNIYIVRKTGMNLNITPRNPKLFIENLNKALADWRRSSKK